MNDNDLEDAGHLRMWLENPYTAKLRLLLEKQKDLSHKQLLSASQNSSDPGVAAAYHHWHATSVAIELLAAGGK